MEIENLVLLSLGVGFLGCFIIYAMTNPLPSGTHVLETVAIGGIWIYLFNNPNFF